MARLSRYQRYMEGLRKNEGKDQVKQAPVSVIKKLKELKDRKAAEDKAGDADE